MKKAIALTIFLIIVLTFLSACSSSDGLTGRTISIFDIIGDKATMTKTDDKEYTAAKGLKLGADYSVSTGETTYVYLDIEDKSLAKMNEESKVNVAQISEAKLRLDLVQGSILVNEREKSKGELEIRAGNTVLGIRGTFITVNNNADVTVFIIEGAIDVTTLSGEVTPVGPGKRVTVVNDVATVDDLEWNMLDSFTRECILEYQNDLSDVLSEDDFNAIRGNNADEDDTTIDKGDLITVTATLISNGDFYRDQFMAYWERYDRNIGSRMFGILFNPPVQLPDEEIVSEAGIMRGTHLIMDPTAPIGDRVLKQPETLTGYLYRDESYTGEIEDVKGNEDYTSDYLYRPNGPYVFEIVSIEETFP